MSQIKIYEGKEIEGCKMQQYGKGCPFHGKIRQSNFFRCEHLDGMPGFHGTVDTFPRWCPLPDAFTDREEMFDIIYEIFLDPNCKYTSAWYKAKPFMIKEGLVNDEGEWISGKEEDQP